jgi:hypothetical protein
MAKYQQTTKRQKDDQVHYDHKPISASGSVGGTSVKPQADERRLRINIRRALPR